jgi:hypothetical protein
MMAGFSHSDWDTMPKDELAELQEAIAESEATVEAFESQWRREGEQWVAHNVAKGSSGAGGAENRTSGQTDKASSDAGGAEGRASGKSEKSWAEEMGEEAAAELRVWAAAHRDLIDGRPKPKEVKTVRYRLLTTDSEQLEALGLVWGGLTPIKVANEAIRMANVGYAAAMDPPTACDWSDVRFFDSETYPNNDGEVRPDRYGGSRQKSYFFCYGSTTPHGFKKSRCRYRHLFFCFIEAMRIMQTGHGNWFLETAKNRMINGTVYINLLPKHMMREVPAGGSKSTSGVTGNASDGVGGNSSTSGATGSARGGGRGRGNRPRGGGPRLGGRQRGDAEVQAAVNKQDWLDNAEKRRAREAAAKAGDATGRETYKGPNGQRKTQERSFATGSNKDEARKEAEEKEIREWAEKDLDDLF